MRAVFSRFALLDAGSELVIGPWSHGGIVDQSVGKDSSFDQPKHSMAFINRCCDHKPASKSDSVSGQSEQNPMQHGQHQLPALAADAHTGGRSSQQDDQQQVLGSQTLPAKAQGSGMNRQNPSSKEEEDAASPSVHFFMMGCESHRGWRACHSWPPPRASSPPLKLYLNKADGPALKKARSWFWSSKKTAQLPTAEPARVDDSDLAQKPHGVHQQQFSDQNNLPRGGERQQTSGHVQTGGHGQAQRQQAGQQEQSDRDLNPAPVSAQHGQTQVTQVVTSRKNPQLGQLTQAAAGQNCRFRHDISLDKHPKVWKPPRQTHVQIMLLQCCLQEACPVLLCAFVLLMRKMSAGPRILPAVQSWVVKMLCDRA